MEEQLVTFETAKLAKEKGFDHVRTNHLPYMLEGDDEGCIGASIYCKVYANCCTQSFLQKWLREAHNINVWVSSKTTDKGNTIFIPHGRTIPDTIKKGLVKDVIAYKTFDNNEEALEFGLQQALKLIE